MIPANKAFIKRRQTDFSEIGSGQLTTGFGGSLIGIATILAGVLECFAAPKGSLINQELGRNRISLLPANLPNFISNKRSGLRAGNDQ